MDISFNHKTTLHSTCALRVYPKYTALVAAPQELTLNYLSHIGRNMVFKGLWLYL